MPHHLSSGSGSAAFLMTDEHSADHFQSRMYHVLSMVLQVPSACSLDGFPVKITLILPLKVSDPSVGPGITHPDPVTAGLLVLSVK